MGGDFESTNYIRWMPILRTFVGWLCDAKGLAFHSVDRVLYVFDKETNGSLSKEKTAK
jgi:hypothetical protein